MSEPDTPRDQVTAGVWIWPTVVLAVTIASFLVYLWRA